MRVGLDAGEPLRDGDDLYGTPVNVASRLCDAAGAGEILATDLVRQIAGHRVSELMQPAGTMRLRGIAERVPTAQVQWRAEEETGDAARAGSEPQAPARPIRVVIADDQRLVRTGFRVILDAEPDIEVVGEAADGARRSTWSRGAGPDVVLMDIRMPELDGLEATRADPAPTPSRRRPC